MKSASLRDLFVIELSDLYDAENRADQSFA